MNDAQGPDDKPFVGRNIPWDAVEQQFLRVLKFTPLATLMGGKVRSPSSSTPYALVDIECPRLETDAVLPIAHREDFRVLWQLYEEVGSDEDIEILLTYFPRYTGLLRLVNAVAHLPKFVVAAYPRGSLEQIYAALSGETPLKDMPRALYQHMPLERHR